MITYFVLKADGGRTAGCVRLENGRARSSCPCTLVLEDGTSLDLSQEETSLPARPLGAAALRGEELLAWGTAPGVKLTGAELLYRLRKGRKEAAGPGFDPGPEPDPEPELTPEPETASEPEAASEPEPAPESEPVSESETAPAEPEDSAALAADFGLLVQHAGEVYEDILHPPLPDGPTEQTEEVKEDWFSETEQLLSRLKRR